MNEEFGQKERKRFSKIGGPGRGASNRKPKVPPPPRVLLCHCLKCDDQWKVQMELIVDPEPPKEKPRGKFRNQKKMVWIFPPESFESCGNCGSKTVTATNARTDITGRVKLHVLSTIPKSLSLEEDDLTVEEDNE